MSSKLSLIFSIFLGKIVLRILNMTNKKGTALPGKIALKVCPDFLKHMSDRCDNIILITGTNGKTTTNNLLNHIIESEYADIASNHFGSNMIQGIVSPFINNTKKHYDWAILEVDEGTIKEVTKFINPDYILITNFFRDQLDRYGEVENTVRLVYDGIKHTNGTLILNGDDPSSVYFEKLKNKKIYYGVKENEHSKDTANINEAVFCGVCGNKLEYDYINYGNIGKFKCTRCGSANPNIQYTIEEITAKADSYEFTVKNKNTESFKFNYMGIYNVYNCLGAISLADTIGIKTIHIKDRVENFEYNLGRNETIEFSNKKVIISLAKNPVGLTEVLTSFSQEDNKKSIMFILNDYGADGKDVSWIWDASMEEVNKIPNIKYFYCAGTRAEEVALRLKYADFSETKIKIYNSNDVFDIEKPIKSIMKKPYDTYIIGTFTSIPKVRRIILNMKKR